MRMFFSDRVRSLLRAEDGSALVEGALILPVFLVLLGGVYEFSFFVYQTQLTSTGIRDAARYLSLSADPDSSISQTNAKNLAVTGLIQGGPLRVSGWSVSDVSIFTNLAQDAVGSYDGSGGLIKVITVHTQFSPATLGFFGLLHLKSPTISATYQQRFVGGSAPG
jgi:hypothetical protein